MLCFGGSKGVGQEERQFWFERPPCCVKIRGSHRVWRRGTRSAACDEQAFLSPPFQRPLLTNQTAEMLAGQQAPGMPSPLKKKENLSGVIFILK